jgi:hypothetical protein
MARFKPLSDLTVSTIMDFVISEEIRDVPFKMIAIDGKHRYLPVDETKRAVFLALTRARDELRAEGRGERGQ